MEWIFLAVAFCLVTGGFTAWLAAQKGYSQGAWFGLGFLFNFVALFAIGFAPAKTTVKLQEKSDPELKPIFKGQGWTCLSCGTKNPYEVSKCSQCGKSI